MPMRDKDIPCEIPFKNLTDASMILESLTHADMSLKPFLNVSS